MGRAKEGRDVYLHLVSLAAGYVADLALGDPHGWPHPVRWMGSLIARLEPVLRRTFPDTPRGKQAAGMALACLVTGISGGVCAAVLALAGAVSPYLSCAVGALVSYWMLATKSLKDESMAVLDALEHAGLPEARRRVSMIVGRDTAALTEEGVTKAAVETVAENASDGVIAPLFYLALLGPVGGVVYKAINTMDSMVGYKNDRYLDFGRAAAKLDDAVNFIPARLAGALMCLAAPLAGFDGKRAWRTFRRDRLAHTSPNSAHTEAACAGALGIQLAGPNYYGGVLVEKPTLGEACRAVEPADIRRANRLLYTTSLLALPVCAGLGALVWTLVKVAAGI